MLQIQTYLSGGLPGQARLKQILPSLFSYFQIITLDSRAKLLARCGLAPIHGDEPSEVTFYFNPNRTNPLQPGRSVALYRPCGVIDPITSVHEDSDQPPAPLDEVEPLQPQSSQAFSPQHMMVSTEALPSPA